MILCSFGCELQDGRLHGIHVLVNQGIATNDFANLLDRAVVRDQFVFGRHVNAIDIGKTHWRCCAGHVDLVCTSITRHLHDFFAGCSAHDGVVHQEHIAPLELTRDRIEFLTNGLLAHRLPRHDEGASDITVFNETFAIRQPQQLRQLRRAGSA